MKKILLLFVAVALASCSKDDPAPSVDPVVGKWIEVSSKSENLQAGIVNNYPAGICSALEPTTFSENNVGNYVVYTESAGECTYLATMGFSWENLGSGNYLHKQNNEVMPMKITFTNNNNTMTEVITEGYYRNTTVYNRQ